MAAHSLPTTPDPEIVIEVGGDLRLAGADVDAVSVEAGDDVTLSADPAGARVSVAAPGDCALKVPRRARLNLTHVGGDARPIKDLAGPVAVGEVGGDLMVRRTGGVQAGRVGGSVSAKEIAGPFSLTGAGGDVSARGVSGAFECGFAGGDLYLRDAQAAASGEAGGDVILHLAFAPGQACRFRANGDIVCRVPPGASARLTVTTTGELSLDVPGAQSQVVDGQTVVRLGAGDPDVALQATGDVFISELTPGDGGPAEGGDDLGDRLSRQVEDQVAARLADVERELNAQLGQLNVNLGSLGRLNAQEIAARARRAAETAQRRSLHAQRKLEAAQRRVERAVERAARPRRGSGLTFGTGLPGGRPPAPSEPVSDQERLAVLRLLEQGRISAAEAEALLAALEGRA